MLKEIIYIIQNVCFDSSTTQTYSLEKKYNYYNKKKYDTMGIVGDSAVVWTFVIPQNSCVEILSHKGNDICWWVLWKVVRFSVVFFKWIESVIFKNKITELPGLFYQVRDQQNGAYYHPVRGPPPDHLGTFILVFPDFRTVRNNLCCL